MTDKEIDFKLALAIGYTKNRVSIFDFWSNGQLMTGVHVLNDKARGDGPQQWSHWQRFDHTAPSVIWPIAERFYAFPERRFNYACEHIGWHCWANSKGYGAHKNPATATALAVIEHCKKETKP